MTWTVVSPLTTSQCKSSAPGRASCTVFLGVRWALKPKSTQPPHDVPRLPASFARPWPQMLPLWGTSVLPSHWALGFLWSQLLRLEGTLMHCGHLHPSLLRVTATCPGHGHACCTSPPLPVCASTHTGNCQPRQRIW